MTDKISEFRRINEPRAMRMVEQLNLIKKSAASMRIADDEVRMMMSPVFKAVDDMRPAIAKAFERPAPAQIRSLAPMGGNFEEPFASAPVAKEMGALADLTTQQLVDRMIACGAELANRRK